MKINNSISPHAHKATAFHCKANQSGFENAELKLIKQKPNTYKLSFVRNLDQGLYLKVPYFLDPSLPNCSIHVTICAVKIKELVQNFQYLLKVPY